MSIFNNASGININGKAVEKIVVNNVVIFQAVLENLLLTATESDRVTIYGTNGYKTGTRISSSGTDAANTNMCATGFIPALPGQTLIVQNVGYVSTTNHYIIAYDSSNNKTGYKQVWESTGTDFTIILDEETFGSDFNAIRLTFHEITDETIISVR